MTWLSASAVLAKARSRVLLSLWVLPQPPRMCVSWLFRVVFFIWTVLAEASPVWAMPPARSVPVKFADAGEIDRLYIGVTG